MEQANFTEKARRALESKGEVKDRIEAFAERLAEIHGPVAFRSEKSGLHLYLACPHCLREFGTRELTSRHLAINIDKHFGIGAHQTFFLKRKRKGVAQCMKMHGVQDVSQLFDYPPLAERGYPDVAPKVIGKADRKRYLVPDGKGNMIPDHPGKTIALTSLPQEHPAIVYLKSRGYEPALLEMQFNARWCEEEAPQGEEYCRFYRRHPFGWRSTPQGRIIFHSMVNGVQLSWQGRYLELDGYVWHPYDKCWQPRPDWRKGEAPIKYITASSSFRNDQVCGYDNAVFQARALGDPRPVCTVSEGPLDAARFPLYGLALLGKYLSDTQIQLIRAVFHRVVLAFDTDKAGREAADQAEKDFAKVGIPTRRLFTPAEYEAAVRDGSKTDAGELGYEECRNRFEALRQQF